MSRIWVPTKTTIHYSITTTKERDGFLGWLARKLKLPYGWTVEHENGGSDYIAVEYGGHSVFLSDNLELPAERLEVLKA